MAVARLGLLRGGDRLLRPRVLQFYNEWGARMNECNCMSWRWSDNSRTATGIVSRITSKKTIDLDADNWFDQHAALKVRRLHRRLPRVDNFSASSATTVRARWARGALARTFVHDACKYIARIYVAHAAALSGTVV